MNPFSGYKENTILELNPHNIVKPKGINRSGQIKCAHLASNKPVVAPFGIANILQGLQDCASNEGERSLLSPGFSVTEYENNPTFTKTEKRCNLKDGQVSCGPALN